MFISYSSLQWLASTREPYNRRDRPVDTGARCDRLGKSPTEDERRVPRLQQRDATLIYEECARVDRKKKLQREAVQEGTRRSKGKEELILLLPEATTTTRAD
jgi:hypothetical protein